MSGPGGPPPPGRNDTDPDVCRATGKVAHRHHRAARRAMNQMVSHLKQSDKAAGSLHVFRCDRCGFFHTGNDDDLLMRARREVRRAARERRENREGLGDE